MTLTTDNPSYEYGCQIRELMLSSFSSRNLESHYSKMASLALEINGALMEAEQRINELEKV